MNTSARGGLVRQPASHCRIPGPISLHACNPACKGGRATPCLGQNAQYRPLSKSLKVRLGMEGADDLLLQPEEAAEGPEVVAKATTVTKAVKKNDWALRSVLKVFVVKVDPNYAQPWQKCPQRSSSGSAFVLDTDKRVIITNAHVLANAVTVYVRRPGNPKKWRASVTCMSKQSDLALLTVPEDGFWGDDLRPLVFLKEVSELQVSPSYSWLLLQSVVFAHNGGCICPLYTCLSKSSQR
eukprot:GHRR01025809.1.p1 GENE.GHRR01025809.1~~GHRR01025809.1.p1  ORF type:complete len:239 (+),score=37.95 GHRR01025809.1:52-768(+)